MDISITTTSESNTPPQPELAVYSTSAHLRFWLVGVIFLILDLWSKAWVFANLKGDEIRPIIANTLDFRRSLNDGAVFGSFTGQTTLFVMASIIALGFVVYMFAFSGRWQRVMQVALGLILAGALGNLYDRCFIEADVVVFKTPAGVQQSLIGKITEASTDLVVRIGQWPDGQHARSFARSEVTIRRQGVVRDFIKFVPKFPSWAGKFAGKDTWPWVFNIADATLVTGVILLLLSNWFDKRPDSSKAQEIP